MMFRHDWCSVHARCRIERVCMRREWRNRFAWKQMILKMRSENLSMAISSRWMERVKRCWSDGARVVKIEAEHSSTEDTINFWISREDQRELEVVVATRDSVDPKSSFVQPSKLVGGSTLVWEVIKLFCISELQLWTKLTLLKPAIHFMQFPVNLTSITNFNLGNNKKN